MVIQKRTPRMDRVHTIKDSRWFVYVLDIIDYGWYEEFRTACF
jgi:hypothetical protein